LVAVTVRGWPPNGRQGKFCVILVADGQARQRECGQLAGSTKS
jgi:hypothetical protein